MASTILEPSSLSDLEHSISGMIAEIIQVILMDVMGL